jgi:hypothetical protein
MAPVPVERVVRRSPLEHADALAHAYETVGATRTVAARALGGVRRRALLSRGFHGLDDAAFLSAVATAWPAVADDCHVVRDALGKSIRKRELPVLSRALARIEEALAQPARATSPAASQPQTR